MPHRVRGYPHFGIMVLVCLGALGCGASGRIQSAKAIRLGDESEIDWFYDRYGRHGIAGYGSFKFTLESFTPAEYRSLIICARPYWSIEAVLRETLIAHLKNQPDDPRFAELMALMRREEYVFWVLAGGRQWVLDLLPSGWWTAKRLQDLLTGVAASDGRAEVVDALVKSGGLRLDSLAESEWLRLLDARESQRMYGFEYVVTQLLYPRLASREGQSEWRLLYDRLWGWETVRRTPDNHKWTLFKRQLKPGNLPKEKLVHFIADSETAGPFITWAIECGAITATRFDDPEWRRIISAAAAGSKAASITLARVAFPALAAAPGASLPASIRDVLLEPKTVLSVLEIERDSSVKGLPRSFWTRATVLEMLHGFPGIRVPWYWDQIPPAIARDPEVVRTALLRPEGCHLCSLFSEGGVGDRELLLGLLGCSADCVRLATRILLEDREFVAAAIDSISSMETANEVCRRLPPRWFDDQPMVLRLALVSLRGVNIDPWLYHVSGRLRDQEKFVKQLVEVDPCLAYFASDRLKELSEFRDQLQDKCIERFEGVP